jgi:hypothetical protein
MKLLEVCFLLLIAAVSGGRSRPLLDANQGECYLEPGYHYDSLWNTTALRVCPGTRPERICILGGGSSGVHIGQCLNFSGGLCLI